KSKGEKRMSEKFDYSFTDRLTQRLSPRGVEVLSLRMRSNASNHQAERSLHAPGNPWITGLTVCCVAFTCLGASTATAEEKAPPVLQMEQLKKSAVETQKPAPHGTQAPVNKNGSKSYVMGDTGTF